jgi:hypothetical protein
MAGPWEQYQSKPWEEYQKPDSGIKALVPKERTWGEAATDIAASIGSGIGKTMQVPGQLYGLITGDMETPQGPPQNTEEAKKALVRGAGNAVMPGMTGIQGLGKRLEEFSESKKSDVLKAKEEERSRIIQEAQDKGLWEQAKAAGAATITDPALLTSFLAEMAPNMIPVGAAARLGRGVVLGGQLAKGVGREAAEAAAQKAGTRAALGAGSVMQGADVGTDTYEEAYKELIAREVPPEEAKQRALNLARASGLSAAAVSLLAQRLPGAQRLEKAFAGTKGTAGRAIGAVKTGLGEAGSEAIEEGGGTFGKNLAMRDIDPEYSLTKGVGTAAALGAIGGGGMGAVTGALQTQEAKPQEIPKPELRTHLNEEDTLQSHPVYNPTGSFSATELGDIAAQVNNLRESEGKHPLKSFSIEDLVDAKVEQPTIDNLIDSKTGYQGEPIDAAQVQEAAASKNIDMQSKGVQDFFTRATGTKSIDEMTPAQLYAAYTGLSNLSPDANLEEGTNAHNFKKLDYDSALEGLNATLVSNPFMDRASVISQIKQNNPDDQQADSILKSALRNGDLAITSTPHFDLTNEQGEVVFSTPNREIADRAAAKENLTVKESDSDAVHLPQTVITEEELTGPADSYDLRAGSVLLNSVKTEEDAYKQAIKYNTIRNEERSKIRDERIKLLDEVQKDKTEVERMEATGMRGTPEYEARLAEVTAKAEDSMKKVQQLEMRQIALDAPVSIVPTQIDTAFKPSVANAATEIHKQLSPLLKKYGLENVSLKIVDSIRNGEAEGNYAQQIISVALDNEPGTHLGVMRHEIIHALKELGAFTPKEWEILNRQAQKVWIPQYMKSRSINYKGQTVPLYDAYRDIYKEEKRKAGEITQEEYDNDDPKGLEGFDEYIQEEAIAEAFRHWKPQAGFFGNIGYRLTQLFNAIRNAFKGLGFQTADSVFKNIEAGKMRPKGEGKGQTKYSLLRPAVPGEIEIATQNPQGATRKYNPYTDMLSIDEKAVLEAMEANPEFRQRTINEIKKYGFIKEGIPDDEVIEEFKSAIVDNLLFLYNSVPPEIRQRSKLWYDGAHKLAVDLAKKYNISMPQVAGIMAAMSPQKDWFQNVSMAERAIDILSKQANKAWDANMLKYGESYVKEAENIKDREAREINFEKMKRTANAGTELKDMNEEEAAFFIRAFDEAYNSRQYRLVTPEGGFGDLVRNADKTPAIMMWSTYIPLEKTVSIFRDGSRNNISDQLGNEHKIRSFYNNIASPNSDIGHVTIDTHAVAAGLFESLAGTDIEVMHNFGAIGGSDAVGVSGTYGIIADAYRDAAKYVGVKPREMQSITWEAVRGIFDENVKKALKAPAKAEWNKYRKGEITFKQARDNILALAQAKLEETGKPVWFKPDWFDSDRGGYVSEGVTSYDQTFVPPGGVRLRTEAPAKYKVSIQLSAATESIPGIKALYSEAMSGDSNSYRVLQQVAESRLNFLIGGTDARIKTDYVKGVYKSDREPAILSTVTFREFDKTAVLAGLAQFAKNFNQQQIHVRQPTAYEFNHDYGDGSYATAVYEIPLDSELEDQQIREVVESVGLDGFTISPATKEEPAKLTTYWVRDSSENETEQREGFKRFGAKVQEARRLVGRGTEKAKQTIERLYVYGDGGIGYDTISGDLRTKKEADEVTPKIVAEHFKQQSVKAFKQKDLTAAQVKEQKLLAGVFERLPVNDLNNPLVRKAYEEAAKDLVAQYNALPIKAEVMADVELNGKIYSYWGLPNKELNRNGVDDLKIALMEEMPASEADAAIKYLRKTFGKPNPKWTGILKKIKSIDIDPYKNNSDAVRKDASLNNRLLVYKTSPRTFGPKGVDFKGHPLLEDSGVKDIHGYPMLYNDVLRVVHDYFAHNLSSTSFGPKGEFAAQRNHMVTTNNPWSRWAIIAETRAQNAWQNFRPGVENLSAKDRGFALQKAALPPIQFALTGDDAVDAPVLKLMKELTPEEQMGSFDPQHPLAIQVRKVPYKPKKPGEAKPEEKVEEKAEEGKYSLRANPAQTKTPEFKQWFGKSKIVTEDGEPKVMYHGTARDITTFRPKQAGAIFVTSNPSFAQNFAHTSEEYMENEFYKKLSNKEKETLFRSVMEENKDKYVKEFGEEWYKEALDTIKYSQSLYKPSTSIRTLPVIFGEGAKVFAGDVLNRIIQNLESRANIMPVYVKAENPFDYENRLHFRILLEDNDIDEYDIREMMHGDWETIESESIQEAIKNAGFDGFYVKEGGEKNLAVYEPSQLKSATGNIGTFDINNPDIRYSIRANLPASTNARIDATTGQRKTEGFMDRILSILNPETRARLRAGFIFQFEALERGTKARAARYGNREYMADVSATAAALESMRSKQIVAAAMRDGVPVYRNGFTTTDNFNGTQKGLLEIFSPLAKTGDPDVWRCFQFYAGSKRGARLDAEGREHLFTRQDLNEARAMAAQFNQMGIDFDAVYRDYQKWNEALVKYMKDTGVLSAADAAYFTRFGDYIPFYRQIDGEATVGPKIFSSIAGVQKPKALKGGTEKLGDFLENVIRNASAAVESGMKNVAANRGIRDALDLGTAHQVPVPNRDTVSIKENGVTKHYELDDPLLFEAFKGLNVPRMPWVQILAKPADVLRNFVTKDPGFILANIMRDSVSAWVTSGSDMKPVVDSFKQFGKILAGQSPEAVAMAKAGLGGYEFKGSLKDSADSFEKALRAKTGTRTKTEKVLLPVTALWDMLEQGSNASDMATRAEIYKRVLAETGNEAEALFQASEVMNFSRKGNFAVMQALTALVPFMNARIQGMDVLYRSGFGQAANANKERMQKAFIVRSLSILAVSAMYWAMVHDDDEYKKLTKEERDGYWIVPGLTFNGKPFRFPIPFEIGVVFKVFPERILELTYGQDTPKDFKESITRNIVDTLKFNPIPQAFIPIYENISNHSFFTGEKIVGRGLEDVAKPLQYTASTSKGARWLGEQTGQSPIQIENVIRGYTGTMGMYAVNMLDSFFSSQGDPVKATTRAEQLPVIKRFFASDSGTVAQYYDLKDEVDEVVRTVNFLSLNDPDKLEGYLKDNENTYMLKDFVSSIEKDMKQIREYRNAINADKDMSGDEKREILDELHQYEIALTSDIKAIRKEYH